MLENFTSALGGLKDMAEKANIKETVAHVGEHLKDVASKAAEVVKEGLRDLPGAAIDNADGDKVSQKLVDNTTKELNNNPRDNDL